MCGIFGIIDSKEIDNSILKNAIKTLKRRGPDDSGIWTNESKNIGLVQTRLSIIDLSKSGHQPMISDDKRYIIVYNGEVYNYKEVKHLLIKKGAVFVTESDTEVILWAWKVFGKDTPKYLRGMFAFAIWDQLERTLTLVRDRLGIKPLLYYHSHNRFIFGSTLSSILTPGYVNHELNIQSFFDYLHLGSVCQPKTIINNVFALLPGNILTFHENGKIDIEEYWKPERNYKLFKELSKYSYNDLVKRTRLILEEAIQYHLVADVQVGSFLSGGVDSTAITALMARKTNYKIKSFSIGFDNGKDMENELPFAKMAAEHIGTEHYEIILSGKDVEKNYDDFIESLDQPSADGINTYWVSKVTHEKGMKVALSGLGGDELFAGYKHFEWVFSYKNKMASFLDKVLSELYPYFPYYFAKNYLRQGDFFTKLSTIRQKFTGYEIRKRVNGFISDQYNPDHLFNYIKSLNIKNELDLAEMTKYELRGYLLNTLLRDADALSMANSIETRPILLDHNLVEFALSLPDESKWRNGVGKAVLKDATADLLPENFFSKPKTGFTLPTTRWLNTVLYERAKDVFSSDYSGMFFSKKYLNRLSKRLHNSHVSRHAYLVFVFLEWVKANKLTV